MNSEWAAKQLEAGKKVRLDGWHENAYIYLKKFKIYNQFGNEWIWVNSNILQNNWELFEEEFNLSEYITEIPKSFGIRPVRGFPMAHTATSNEIEMIHETFESKEKVNFIPFGKVKEFIEILEREFCDGDLQTQYQIKETLDKFKGERFK